MELAPKVRVNCVLPGAIVTEMTENISKDEELTKRMADTYPLGFGQKRYIADAVEFLFSDKSSWITGQEIVVDGGRSVNMTG